MKPRHISTERFQHATDLAMLRSEGRHETDEFELRHLPDRTLAGRDRRLVDAADRARCVARRPALRRFPEATGPGAQHLERAAQADGRQWPIGAAPSRRWRR